MGWLRKHFWDLYAICYDAISALIPYRQMMADVIQSLDLQPGMTILNAGCGTGSLEREIAKTGINVRVIAVDLSGAMIKRAREKNRGSGTQYVIADLNETLPFSDNTFDRIVSSNVLYALDNPAKTVGEFNRVLTNGGIMVHTTPRQKPSLASIFGDHLRQADLLQKLAVLLIIPPLLAVLIFNLIILARGRSGRYHFFSQKQVEDTSGCTTIAKPTYAGQSWLTRSQKGVNHDPDSDAS